VRAIQRSYRRMMVCRHLERDEAAGTIQRAWLGYYARSDYTAKRTSAIQLQSFARLAACRRSYVQQVSSVRAIQRSYRRTRLCRQRDHAATFIQSLVRKWASVHVYRQCRYNAVLIQAVWKGYNERGVFGHQLASAVLIQSCTRRYQAKSEFMLAVVALVRIQSCWRRKLAETNYTSSQVSIVLIQSVCRGIACREKLSDDLSRVRLCVLLQSLYRGVTVRNCLVAKRKAATKIQLIWRQFFRSVIGIHKLRHLIKIQSFARCYLWQIQLERRSMSAKTIQVLYLTWRMKCRLEKVTSAVIQLQSIVRGHLVRSSNNSLCHSPHEGIAGSTDHGVILLQRYARRHSAARAASASRIQEVWRRRDAEATNVTSRSLLLGDIPLKSVPKLQGLVRSYLVRQRVARWHSRSAQIQSILRRHRDQVAYEKLYKNVLTIQAAARMHLEEVSFKKKRSAALLIQRYFRSCRHDETLHVKNTPSEMQRHYAAVNIQCYWRHALVRAQFNCAKQSAVLIQKSLRCYINWKRYQHKLFTILIVQRHWRRVTCQKHLSDSRLAAVHVQAAWRRFQGQRSFLDSVDNIILAQIYARRYIAARKFSRLKREAAIALEAEHSKLINHATTIQCAVRRFLIKCHLATQHEAASLVQCYARSWIAYRKARRRMCFIVLLQSWGRCQLEARSYRCSVAAVVRIQSFARRCSVQSRFSSMKVAASLIQRNWCIQVELSQRIAAAKKERERLAANEIAKESLRKLMEIRILAEAKVRAEHEVQLLRVGKSAGSSGTCVKELAAQVLSSEARALAVTFSPCTTEFKSLTPSGEMNKPPMEVPSLDKTSAAENGVNVGDGTAKVSCNAGVKNASLEAHIEDKKLQKPTDCQWKSTSKTSNTHYVEVDQAEVVTGNRSDDTIEGTESGNNPNWDETSRLAMQARSLIEAARASKLSKTISADPPISSQTSRVNILPLSNTAGTNKSINQNTEAVDSREEVSKAIEEEPKETSKPSVRISRLGMKRKVAKPLVKQRNRGQLSFSNITTSAGLSTRTKLARRASFAGARNAVAPNDSVELPRSNKRQEQNAESLSSLDLTHSRGAADREHEQEPGETSFEPSRRRD